MSPPSDEALETARAALDAPGMAEALDALPPELARLLRQARAALDGDRPREALAALGLRAAGRGEVDPDALPTALQQILDQQLAGAPAAPGVAREGRAALDALEGLVGADLAVDELDGAEALQEVLATLRELDLARVLGPVFDEVAGLQEALGGLRLDLADPAAASARADELQGRAHALRKRVRTLDEEGLAATLLETVETLQALRPEASDQAPLELLRAAAAALDQGQPAQAAAVAGRMAALAERTGDRPRAIRSRYEQGLLLVRAGHRERGQDHVRGALDDARELGDPDLISEGVVALGEVLEMSGAAGPALDVYGQVLGGEHGSRSAMRRAALGTLRSLPGEALADPHRMLALRLLRVIAVDEGDAVQFFQASTLLAESLDADGDRPGAVWVLLEARDALLEAGGPEAARTAVDALGVLRDDWGPETFDAILARLLESDDG